MLNKLPPPPQGKTGWPWTEESEILPRTREDGTSWPFISIITPSYNHGEFIEETIRSILLQNYPSLEYIIIDGGSTDNSVEIIRKYEKWITFWISEKDNGQSDAINKGFQRCTGELVNWICSDDMLCRNALVRFVRDHYYDGTSLYIGKCLLADKNGKIYGATESRISTFDELVDLKHRWRNGDSIAQQSALYPLESVLKIGGLRIDNHYSMDYELWGDLLLENIKIRNIPLEIGIFRWYQGQKTSDVFRSTKDLVLSGISLVKRNNNLPLYKASALSLKIRLYYICFIYHHIRSIFGVKRRFKKLTNWSIRFVKDV